MRQNSIINPNQAVYADEHLLLDFVSQSAILYGDKLELTRKEYQLLAHIVQHAGEVLTRDTLLREVWGYGPAMRTRTVDVHVRRLRKKLGNYADGSIETVFGVGYRFQPRHEAYRSRISVVNPALPASV